MSNTPVLAPADLLVQLETWILNRLEHLEYRRSSDASGHPHGGGVAYIPEWELRTKRDEIRATLDSLKATKPRDPFWDSPTIEELCEQQGITGPTDLDALAGLLTEEEADALLDRT